VININIDVFNFILNLKIKKEKITMTKKDQINKLAEKLQTTKKDAETIINTYWDVLKEGVAQNGKIQITDVITIEAKEMSSRKGRNPQTGQEIEIPARLQLFAKFGKGFKDFVNS
jgi:DNA-binding protein HU-beta